MRNFEGGSYYESMPEIAQAPAASEAELAISEEDTAIRPPENPEWGPNRASRIPESGRIDAEPASDAIAITEPTDPTNDAGQQRLVDATRLARYIIQEGDVEITYHPE